MRNSEKKKSLCAVELSHFLRSIVVTFQRRSSIQQRDLRTPIASLQTIQISIDHPLKSSPLHVRRSTKPEINRLLDSLTNPTLEKPVKPRTGGKHNR